MNFEDEIDLLEATLSHLEDAIEEIKDVPYYKHLKDGWEADKIELEARLSELSDMQNEQWEAEERHQINEYWGAVI